MNTWMALAIAFLILAVGAIIVGGTRRHTDPEDAILLTLLSIVLFVAFLIPGIITSYNDAAHVCDAKGGHILTTGRSSLCVSSDGRILE